MYRSGLSFLNDFLDVLFCIFSTSHLSNKNNIKIYKYCMHMLFDMLNKVSDTLYV